MQVVVHVLYKTSTQNVANSYIIKQIEYLNKDFTVRNSDANNVPTEWVNLQSGLPIKFYLATTDPSGNKTSGILKKLTNRTSFDRDNLDEVKSTNTGGSDPWDATQYLNIWVCEVKGRTLGIATFPEYVKEDPQLDGVVIRHEAFGIKDTASVGYEANNKGRTLTHEVGHWLGLFHIWGDGNANECGTDEVEDTPSADSANYFKPTFPHKVGTACTSDPNGQMFMNYMDYTDDEAMCLFTKGQTERMWMALNKYRSNFVQNGTSISSKSIKSEVKIFPNPSNGNIRIENLDKQSTISKMRVYDMVGVEVANIGLSSNEDINLKYLPKSIYMLIIETSKGFFSEKLILD